NWVKDTTQRSVGRLVADTVRQADRGGMLSIFLPRLEKAIADMDTRNAHSRDFRRLLSESLDEAVASL
ncbi:hypothetical protein, partial [Paramuribaculum intestinale]